eukprot:TRINITY_DN4560_c0_g1_i1.p2 TRINITY_DN4560_c0_g1~~TRINITY_DN4560_c0_g1_i1.p2  ORF type:complete len:62 (+),score=7.04 TRINITY_DN4560_c0_g1_i1:109-294(+)
MGENCESGSDQITSESECLEVGKGFCQVSRFQYSDVEFVPIDKKSNLKYCSARSQLDGSKP